MTIAAPHVQGLVQENEGLNLSWLAQWVPADQAIVEVGSHTGGSTAWMGHGSRAGFRAHIFAIGPWGDPRPGSDDDPFGLGPGDVVLARFMENMRAEHVEGLVTPLRALSVEVARYWVQPIGLLFIDAVHEYEHVLTDYRAWAHHVARGGWLAFHDYWDDPQCTVLGEVGRMVEEVVVPSGLWGEPHITGGLWTAQRQ